jgi:hypothetical protein
MRVGTMVRVRTVFSGRNGQIGKITSINVPGQTSKSGTKGFKYVKFPDGMVLGHFRHELERVKP